MNGCVCVSVSGKGCTSDPPVESFSGRQSKIINQDKEESTYTHCNLTTHPDTQTHTHICMYAHPHDSWDKNSTAWVTTAQMQGRMVTGHMPHRTENNTHTNFTSLMMNVYFWWTS